MKKMILACMFCLLWSVYASAAEKPVTVGTPLPLREFVGHPEDSTHMIIGLSSLEFFTAAPAIVGVQTDRGVRDIFWKDSAWDYRVAYDNIPKRPADLVPYMEGLRAAELMEWAGTSVLPLSPSTVIKKADGLWYGSDGSGNFRFNVLSDKVAYPSTRSFRIKGRDYAILYDTHGFASIAAPAIDRKKTVGLDLAIACMDSPDKAKAALFLASEGIACYAVCDRFSSEIVGYKERYGVATTILGSAPIRKIPGGAVIGKQPVKFSLSEPIVTQFTEKKYPDQYCDAPWRYLTALNKVYGLNLKLQKVAANVGETVLLTKEAERIGAKAIAARIFGEKDYIPLKAWLDVDPARRIILLHSAAYEFGIKLLREYPARVTFGDLSPVFVSEKK